MIWHLLKEEVIATDQQKKSKEQNLLLQSETGLWGFCLLCLPVRLDSGQLYGQVHTVFF